MMEARAEYVKHNGLTRSEFILTRSAFMSKLGGCFGWVANLFTQAMWFRWVLEIVGGLDRRRAMPRFAWGDNVGKLRSYIKRLGPVDRPVDKVAYFVDLFGRHNDHELARAVVDVLRYNGVEVIVPDQRDAAMPAISYGDLRYGRKVVEYNVGRLAAVVKAGYKIVCSEPTAALCLRSEYPDVIDNEQSRLVAANTWELTGYLAGLHKEGKLRGGAVEVNLKLAYHEPCHYAAIENGDGSVYLMRQIKGVRLEMLPKSCCGIAGTFGFQKKNFDLSMLVGGEMLRAFANSDADYGLTECGTCKMQMEFGGRKKVVHPIKVLAASYGLLGLKKR
jgi:Fe-S oxidoreductase